MDQMMATKPAVDAPPPYVLADRHWLDLTSANSQEVKLTFSSSVWDCELFLVIDLYSAANPVHPAGHVGWWKWPLEVKGDLTVQVTRGAAGFVVTFDGHEPQEFWRNPDFSGVDEPVIAVHIVLRPVVSEAVRFDDILHLYNAPPALAASQARCHALDHPLAPAASIPWYGWPRSSVVHLVSTNVFEHDAVGNFALSLYRLLRANDVPCQLYADQFDASLRGTIRRTCELFAEAGETDVVILNFSIFDPWLPRLVELASKKILYFHNITPPRFLQIYDAEYADHCADGIAQLKHLHHFDVVVANSASSARVLQKAHAQSRGKQALPEAHFAPSSGPFEEASRLLQKAVSTLQAQTVEPLEVAKIPPIIGAMTWHDVGSEPIDLPPQSTLLLYVGRIAPHKRIEDLFALFDQYHQLNPDSALLVVGGARFDGYVGFLRYLLANEYPSACEHIHFRDRVTDGQLKTLYERCSALVTMSEHEGFCVPIVEAMVFDKPIFAYADEAVTETLGRSGRVFFDKDFEAIAADLHRILSNPWAQRLMVAEQHKRLLEISEQSTGRPLWEVLERVIPGPAWKS